MGEAAGPRGVIRRNVAISPEAIAIGDQTLQSHGPPGRKGLGADANLRTEAVPESVGKTTGAVVIDPGTVDSSKKAIGRRLVFREDHLGMTRAITADVISGLRQVIHQLHRQDQIEIFGAPILLIGQLSNPERHAGCIPPQANASPKPFAWRWTAKTGRAAARKSAAMLR